MDDDIQNTRHIEFHIHGMDCVEEITVLKRELLPILGSEERLAFDLLTQKLTVDVSTQDVTQNELLVAIERAGLKARLWDDELKGKETKPFFEERQRAIVTTLSGICGLTGLVIQLAYQSTYSIPLLSITFYCLGIIAGLYMVIPKVWRALVSFRPDMNLLMSIAVIGAVLIGEWFEGATVAFLFSFSLLLESWSVGRARRSIAKLMDLSPPISRMVSMICSFS